MKLDGIREELRFYSGKASELTRQFAFAGIAVAWLFKIDHAGQPTLPRSLVVPVVALVLSLFFDFGQYCYGAVAYSLRYDSAEREKRRKGLGEDAKFKVSRRMIVRPIDLCFYIKVFFIGIAYIWLIAFLFLQLFR